MKVFIIIVTYNAIDWLDKCLGSLRNSTIPITTVVIDNNSQDDSVFLIKTNYPEVTLIESPINLGFGRANNLGISYGLQHNADYFLLINQDAWVEPNVIEKLINICKENPEYYILSPLHCIGNKVNLDKNFSFYISQSNSLLSDSLIRVKNLNSVYKVNFINAAIWLLPKECILNIGGFDPLFPHYGEDSDYVNRLTYHGYKIGVCPELIGYHDRNQSSFDLKNFSTEKLRNWRKISYLIVLKNINHSLFYSIRRCLSNFKIIFFKNIKELNLKILFLESQIFISTLLNLKEIIHHRNISKNKNKNFL